MGAAFTRFVTLSVREKARTKDILSIGPCQTPTCGFVYEREKAIRAFQAKDFWKITAIFSAEGGEFEGSHRAGNIHEKEKASEIFKKLKGTKEGLIAKKTVKETKTSPPNPLNTTEFLKRASKFLGISPEIALEVAEQLYLILQDSPATLEQRQINMQMILISSPLSLILRGKMSTGLLPNLSL